MDIYHVLNRGVDKRVIFNDSQDYARFVHDMFIFNDNRHSSQSLRVERHSMDDIVSRPSPVETLVDIHGWCLMSNHYHLLLSERVDGGVSKFLRRLNVGYAKYFNERYKRTGTLFQGRTKKIRIDSDAYMLHILNYIHLNPLDLQVDTHNWRSRSINNYTKALKFLGEYRWSSYLDYAGIKNFPSILRKDFFQDVFQREYAVQLQQYLSEIDVNDIKHLLHE